ncbi:MAG: ROK family protein [Cellvibrionaceae bacterium]
MYIGIDLGGTKTEIICLDEQGRELYRYRTASPQHDYLATIDSIKQLVLQAENHLSQTGSVGIGIPGSLSLKTGTVKNANSVWLNGRHLKQDVELALERTVCVDNDANCFALSEALDGAAKGCEVVFGAILGTGCGGGIVINHQLVSGFNGLGGEWGHNPLPFPKIHAAASLNENSAIAFFDSSGKTERSAIYHRKKEISYFSASLLESEYPGPLCYCGKRGCLETWVSGRGLSNDYQRHTGENLPAERVVELATQGHPNARVCLDYYYERLAKSFAQVINTLDPHVIVCGGGLSNLASIYTEIPERWDKYVFSDQFTTRLVQAHHGDSSGVRGAAFLCKNLE